MKRPNVTLDQYLRLYGYPTDTKASQMQYSYSKPQNHFPKLSPMQQQLNFADKNYHHKNMNQSIRHVFSIDDNFPNSQTQCLRLVQRLKQMLQIQKEQMRRFTEQHYKMIHDDFLQQHENVRKSIIEMLQKHFSQSEARIKQTLMQKGNITPIQFQVIINQLEKISNQLEQIQEGLKGHDYRDYIAKTVTKHYEIDIQKLRKSLLQAQNGFSGKMVDIQIDQKRLKNIDADLQRIFVYVEEGKFTQQHIRPPINFTNQHFTNQQFPKPQHQHPFQPSKTNPVSLMKLPTATFQGSSSVNPHQNRDKLRNTLFKASKTFND